MQSFASCPKTLSDSSIASSASSASPLKKGTNDVLSSSLHSSTTSHSSGLPLQARLDFQPFSICGLHFFNSPNNSPTFLIIVNSNRTATSLLYFDASFYWRKRTKRNLSISSSLAIIELHVSLSNFFKAWLKSEIIVKHMFDILSTTSFGFNLE